jgi:hypothetical protein
VKCSVRETSEIGEERIVSKNQLPGHLLMKGVKAWVAIAVGCVSVTVATGCSAVITGTAAPRASAGVPITSAIKRSSIPGIGATRADWNASHTPNSAFNNGKVYGDNPSLPSFLAANGAVYIKVFDLGTDRIQSYTLNMHEAGRHQALERLQQELPADAKVAWELTFDHCYRVAFDSATLQAAGHYMAEVQLDNLREDGTTATNPETFNEAAFQLDAAGSPPNSQIDCRNRIRESTVDLRAEQLRPAP